MLEIELNSFPYNVKRPPYARSSASESDFRLYYKLIVHRVQGSRLNWSSAESRVIASMKLIYWLTIFFDIRTMTTIQWMLILLRLMLSQLHQTDHSKSKIMHQVRKPEWEQLIRLIM